MESNRRRAALAVSVALLTACGGDDFAGDAAIDAETPDAAAAPYVIPWLSEGAPPISSPELTPCPDGWREVPAAGGAPAYCDPYPADGAMDCATGEAHFPGEPGCAPAGAACPAGEFPDALPDGVRIVYVRPGVVDGDGSAGSPFGSLDRIPFGVLPTNSVIALARGTHVGRLELTRGITIVGTCAGGTRLTPPDTTGGTLVTVESEGVTLRNLTLADADGYGVLVDGRSARVSLEGVSIERAAGGALRIRSGAEVEARGLVLRNTLTGERTSGRGIEMTTGAALRAERVVVEDNRDIAIFAGEDTSLTISDGLVRRTEGRESDLSFGRGIGGSGTVALTRVLVEDNHQAGISATGATATVTLDDVVVRRIDGRQSDGAGGVGIVVQEGASVVANRLVVTDNRGVGVLAIGAGSEVSIADALVARTAGEVGNGRFGRAIEASAGAVVEVDRAVVEDSRYAALFATGAGTTLTLTDLWVRRTAPQESDDTAGRGLTVQEGAHCTVVRAAFEDQHDIGILLHARASGTLSDVVVRGTRAQRSDGHFGRGINVQMGASVEITRALVEEQRGLGLGFLISEGALRDVLVRQTAPQACRETTCADDANGHGMGVYRSTVTATGFGIADSALCGLLLANDAEVDLSNGEISGQPLGVCLQVDGFDINRLTDNVRFVENGTNLETTTLPVPEFATDAP